MRVPSYRRSKSLIVAFIALAAFVVAGCTDPNEVVAPDVLPTLPPPSSSPGCIVGSTDTQYGTVSQFCGPARATVVVGDTTYAFTEGSCETTDTALVANIGQLLYGSAPVGETPNYFGAALGDLTTLPDSGLVLGSSPTPAPLTGDGQYVGDVIITGSFEGQDFLATQTTVNVYDNRTRFEFVAQDLSTLKTMSGTFTCA